MHQSLLPAFAVVSFSLVTALPAQLAGTYLINPTLPPSPGSFDSLAAATAALAAQGVAGPVEFLLFDDAGPYTESATWTSASAGGTYGVPVGNTPNAVMVMASWTGASAVNRITFRPAPGENVVFDASNRSVGVFWGGADYVTLQGIEIANAAYDGVSLYAEASHGIAQDPIIDGCRIHDIGGPAVTIYGNTPQPSNTLVQNCTIWRCELTAGGPFYGVGRFGYINTRRSNGTRIVHNTFVVDAGSGGTFCVFGSYTSNVAEVPYVEVSNNIVYRTAPTAGPMFWLNTPAGATFPLPLIADANCYTDTSSSVFAQYGPSATTLVNTLADWQVLGLGLGSFFADPVFRDLAGYDLHLQAVSPCIGISPLVTGVARDADGQQRTAPFDIGADEFGASAVASVGSGCPTSSGGPVELSPTSWPFLGNAAFGLGYADVPPLHIVGLFGSLGLSPVPIPLGGTCTALIDIGSLVTLGAALSGPAGTASIVMPVPSSPAAVGFEIAYQGVVLDAATPLGFATTNAVDIVFDF